MKKGKQIMQYIAQKRILKCDVFLFLLLILTAFGVYKGKERYELLTEPQVEVVNPYLAQPDKMGNVYVIDNERSRVIKINNNRQVDFLLQSNLLEEDTFWYAEDITVGDDGTIYLLDASWNETGSAVGRECVLAYDNKGRYQDTILDIVYENEWVDKHKLFALTFYENSLYYVASEQDGFYLYVISSETGQMQKSQFFSYDNAFNLIQDYALDAETHTVYALDKRGRILKAANGEIVQLYDTAEDPVYKGKAAFYRIAVDGQDCIYITDIKGNRIFSYQEEQDSLNVFMEQGEVLSITSCVEEDGNTILGIWLDWGILIRNVQGDEEPIAYSFDKNIEYRLKEGMYQAAFLLLAVSVVWFLIRILSMLQYIKMSQTQKNGMLAGGTAALVAFVIVTQLLSQFEEVYKEELMSKLYVLGYTACGMIDGNSVERVRTSEDYMSEDYQKLMEILNMSINREEPSIQEVYCNVLRYEDGRGFAIAYLDNSIGTFYPLDAVETEELDYIYRTGKVVRNDGKDDVTGSYIYVRVPVIADDGEVTCVIEVGTTSEVISDKVDEMRQSVMITLVLVILIVILLFGEVLSFFDLKAKYKKKEVHQKNEMPLHLLRLGIFITYMAFNVSSSFLPVYAASFVTDQLGIPNELAASLPITLNLAFIGLTSLFCARILERLSFRTVFVGSAGICMVGDLMLFLGQGYYWIVLGLILNGMGVGFITNSAYMFLAGSSQEEVQKEGFSLFNAGSLAGINCGMMIGASLAENLGQRLVFCCSAGAWLLVAVLFFIMGKHIPRIQRERKQRKKAGKFGVLKMPFMYMLLIQFPYIIINSFVFYYVPIYGDEHGFGESIVCLLLMLNSLCSVFLSVVLTNYMSRKYKEKSIFISSVIAYAALLLFGWNNSVVMLVIVLIMLGIAGSFGNAVRQLYFTQLPEVKQYGEESAMGIYNFMDNIGESAGPMLFGSIFSRVYAFTGLAAFVAVSGIMNGIYVLFNKKNGKSR